MPAIHLWVYSAPANSVAVDSVTVNSVTVNSVTVNSVTVNSFDQVETKLGLYRAMDS